MTGERILVVDDALETSKFLAEDVLTPEGYEAYFAPNGIEALKMIQEQEPDLIIADFLMPHMTGLDMLEKLKNDGRKIPFILITAEGSEKLAVRALRLGVRDYLIKPFGIDEFLTAVAHVLGTRANRPAKLPSNLLDWERILSHANELILVTTEDKRLLYWNPAAQHALNIDPNIESGSTLAQAIDNEDLTTAFETVQGTKSDHQNTKTHFEVQTANDKTYNLHLSLIVGIGYLAVMQDITEMKAVDRAKSEFVTAISHDLRSPLTTILGYVELLGRAGPLNEQQTRFTDNILFSVRSITALLTDLLELSKIEAGRDQSRERVSMDLIIRYATETFRTQLEKKQQVLKTEIASDIKPVWGNSIRLKQVVANLIENAIKYTPVSGTIDLKLYQDDNFVVLQVKDSGVGISLEAQPYIWDKFYRAEEITDSHPGTGLGLSIVKSIVDAHDGRIWTTSTPNEGSTFTVMLPAYTHDSK